MSTSPTPRAEAKGGAAAEIDIFYDVARCALLAYSRASPDENMAAMNVESLGVPPYGTVRLKPVVPV